MLNIVFNANPNKCCHRAFVWKNVISIVPKDIYEGYSVDVKFDRYTIKVPWNYTHYLEIIYGDYMAPPPIEQRKRSGSYMIIDIEKSIEKYIFSLRKLNLILFNLIGMKLFSLTKKYVLMT